MRLMFVVFVTFVVLAMLVVLYVVVVESRKPESNYTGLAALVTALLVSAVGAFWQKATQKKYEKQAFTFDGLQESYNELQNEIEKEGLP